MKVLALGIWSRGPEYPRPANLLEGLREAGAVVTECHFSMAGDFDRRLKSVKGVAGPLRFALALAASYPALAWRYLRSPAPDAVLLPYPGVFHLPLARFLRLFRRQKPPIALDLFFSLHEAVVADRRLLAEGSLASRLLYWLERRACRGADVVLTDTGAHARWTEGYFGLPAGKAVAVPVGPAFAPFPQPAPAKSAEPGFTVLFVGTYIPLHGIETILAAASLLAGEPDIRFLLVGKGQLRGEMEKRAREFAGPGVEFRDWVPTEELGALYRSCALALGVFGVTAKAGRVIPSKVYDMCAAGVPFVTADTPAIREAFTDGENACLVPPGDPRALAGAIRLLKGNAALRLRLAEGAHRLAQGRLSRRQAGLALAACLVKTRQPC